MISKTVLAGLLVLGAIWLYVEQQGIIEESQEFQVWMREHNFEFSSQAEQYYRA
jgi:hypothetical protein